MALEQTVLGGLALRRGQAFRIAFIHSGLGTFVTGERGVPGLAVRLPWLFLL